MQNGFIFGVLPYKWNPPSQLPLRHDPDVRRRPVAPRRPAGGQLHHLRRRGGLNKLRAFSLVMTYVKDLSKYLGQDHVKSVLKM